MSLRILRIPSGGDEPTGAQQLILGARQGAECHRPSHPFLSASGAPLSSPWPPGQTRRHLLPSGNDARNTPLPFALTEIL